MKELITNFVIPRLDKIDQKLDQKADAASLDVLERRVDLLEKTALSNQAVKGLIKDALEDVADRRWGRKEQVFGIIGVLVLLASFIFNILSAVT